MPPRSPRTRRSPRATSTPSSWRPAPTWRPPRQVLFENGDWDSGLAALSDPAAAGLDVRVVRGDPATGGHMPDDVAATFAARYGAGHVTMIAGAPHSPQGTHPDELAAALRHALD